jgi:hypothetical protein
MRRQSIDGVKFFDMFATTSVNLEFNTKNFHALKGKVNDHSGLFSYFLVFRSPVQV